MPRVVTLFVTALAVVLAQLGQPAAEEPRTDRSRYQISVRSTRPWQTERTGLGQKAPKGAVTDYDENTSNADYDEDDCRTRPEIPNWIPTDLSVIDSLETPGLTTFNGENLGIDTPKMSNVVMGFTAPPGAPGFATAPGYGNDWDSRVSWWRPAPDSGFATGVEISLQFNHDLEPGHDFFLLEWNDAGTWTEIQRVSGTNKNASGMFVTPATWQESWTAPPSSYTGPGLDRIELRLRVRTDHFGSDQDGLWPSDGAAQVDDIQVKFNGGVISTADFDTGSSGWTPETRTPFGDFAKTLEFATPDPCNSNPTCQLCFVDDGTPPRNGGPSTGGSISANWAYGPGGYVVNYTGGGSGDEQGIHNEAYSEVFEWDPDNDGLKGAFLEFDVFKHLPLENGLFYLWHVRSYDGTANAWTPWRDHGMVYYSPGVPHYDTHEVDVTTLMTADPESVQISLGVIDLSAQLGLPGDDATPSPAFDDVVFGRFPLTGPSIYARSVDLFQDSFPQSGDADYTTPDGDLAVRLDMARDINPRGMINIPGDSVVVEVAPTIVGSVLTGPPVMKWALYRSPVYPPGTRTFPPGSGVQPGVHGDCQTATASAVAAGVITGTEIEPNGATTPGRARYAFDLPDGPAHAGAPYQANEPVFMVAGDILHYFFEVSDDLGNTSTLPADTTGFFDFRSCGAFHPSFKVRGLPSLLAGPGGTSHPELLVVQDSGDGELEELTMQALEENGYWAGVNYDLYTVKEPSAGASNGIGSAGSHGATPAQLAGYSRLIYLAGDQTNFLLSNGSNQNGNDKGQDVQLLSAWHGQSDDRYAVYFGDNLVDGLRQQSILASAYLQTVMATEFVDRDVRDDIDGQVSPMVAPTGSAPGFSVGYVAGGCLGSNEFDLVEPRAGTGAVASHEFLSPSGSAGAYTAAAGVWYQRMVMIGMDSFVRVDATFPTALSTIVSPQQKALAGSAVRSQLLGEILTAFGLVVDDLDATDVDPATPRRLVVAQNWPNPFNPSTSIGFDLPRQDHVTVRVFDLRGKLVATLLDEVRERGAHSVRWQGTDRQGRSVASGMYLYEVATSTEVVSQKMTLLR